VFSNSDRISEHNSSICPTGAQIKPSYFTVSSATSQHQLHPVYKTKLARRELFALRASWPCLEAASSSMVEKHGMCRD